MTAIQYEDTPKFMPPEQSEHPASFDRITVSRGMNDAERNLTPLIKMRSAFVTALGWFEKGHIDGDVYDIDPRTQHMVFRHEQSDDIIAALRLTSVDNVKSSLSWEMIQSNPKLVFEVESHIDEDGQSTLDDLNHAASTGNLYDLTRLVSPLDGSATISEIKGAMVELFGYAAGVTAPDIKDEATDLDNLHNVRWLFASTESLERMLTSMGIEHTVLTKGRVSEKDTSDSCFCVVKPIEAMRAMYERTDGSAKRVQDQVTAGLSRAARTAIDS
jgi:hypothetical protein